MKTKIILCLTVILLMCVSYFSGVVLERRALSEKFSVLCLTNEIFNNYMVITLLKRNENDAEFDIKEHYMNHFLGLEYLLSNFDSMTSSLYEEALANYKDFDNEGDLKNFYREYKLRLFPDISKND